MRFYVDGYELDVQDPTFFMDKKKYTEIKENLDEILNTYFDLPINNKIDSYIDKTF